MTEVNPQDYMITEEPYYRPVGDEVEKYLAAYEVRMPVMLKGPTGCGKSRFVEYIAWKLKRPLITVACNEDMTAADLVGRYLLDVNGTRWADGPLTVAARIGAICYLDEVVEARQDTTVVIHPLTDHRRELPLEKKGEVVKAHPDFQLVISYNPGYQSLMKDLKQSTKQRFGAMSFDYPEADVETEIVAHEAGVDKDVATKLVQVAERSRNLKGHLAGVMRRDALGDELAGVDEQAGGHAFIQPMALQVARALGDLNELCGHILVHACLMGDDLGLHVCLRIIEAHGAKALLGGLF
jgi:nitric oxide reductase NorQ protein